MKKSILLSICLTALFAAPVYADTSIAGQFVATTSEDQLTGGTASGANYPGQSFIPTVSGTVTSIAVGTTDVCGLQITDALNNSIGSDTANTGITGGTRFTVSATPVTAGLLYYINTGCNNVSQIYTGTQVDTYTDGEAGHKRVAGAPAGLTWTNNAYVGLTLMDWAFSICTDSDCTLTAPVVNTTTHIETVTPAASSTIATSTAATFGATGYVNANDYISGMFVEIQYAPFSAMITQPGASPDTAFTKLQFPITSAGSFSFSTTSPATRLGEYTMQTRIRKHSYLDDFITWFGFGQSATYGILTATSTTFVASTTSAYDQFVRESQHQLEDYIGSASSTAQSCIPSSSFSIGTCIYFLFVPQMQPTLDALNQFKNTFLTYAPWGYVTRFVTIMSGNGGGGTGLPDIDITIPVSPTVPDIGFHLDVNAMFAGGGALLDNVHTSFGDDASFRDVFEPMVDFDIALGLTLYIIYDLLRIRKGSARIRFNPGRRGHLS